LPLPDAWLPLGLFVTLFSVALAAWQTWRAVQTSGRGVSEVSEGVGGAPVLCGVWLAYLAFVPVLLLFLFSQWQPVFVERALLPSGVMFLLWMAWALCCTPMPRPVRTLVLALLLVGAGLGVYQHITYRGFPYAPYAELDASLRERAAPDEVILHSNKLTMLPAVYYDPDLPQRYLADPPGSGSDTLALPTQQALGLIAERSLEAAVGDAPRVWFVIFERAIREYRDLGYETHPHLTWLDAHYRLERVETWDDVLLYVYAR